MKNNRWQKRMRHKNVNFSKKYKRNFYYYSLIWEGKGRGNQKKHYGRYKVDQTKKAGYDDLLSMTHESIHNFISYFVFYFGSIFFPYLGGYYHIKNQPKSVQFELHFPASNEAAGYSIVSCH